MRGVNWLKDVRSILMDDTHALFESRQQFESLTTYDNLHQPTSPSVGRVWRFDEMFALVEEDPKPGYVLRRSRIPLFLEEI